jgi:hypothetical protein
MCACISVTNSHAKQCVQNGAEINMSATCLSHNYHAEVCGQECGTHTGYKSVEELNFTVRTSKQSHCHNHNKVHSSNHNVIENLTQ